MIRRDFFKFSSVTALSLGLFASSSSADEPKKSSLKTKIAILGGGFAGLSVAKFLKEFDSSLDITVIEKRALFISCPYSNTWLGGLKDINYDSLCFDYNSAVEKYGYNFLNEEISNVNIKDKTIHTSNRLVEYEYVIFALGIEYNYEDILKDVNKITKAKTLTPAGLKPGSEQLKLKKMVESTKSGNFVITVPNGSYKCPPAPYERACMIANYFKTNKIDAKVVILDSREKPAAKAKAFLEVFSTLYKDFIEYKPLCNFKDIDFDKKQITYEEFDKRELEFVKKEISYKEASIMPTNKAHTLLEKSGLALYKNGWAKLQNPSFRSVSDDSVYVIGDAQGEYKFPKSAQMAYSTSLILAKELFYRISGKKFNYKENLPGNVCYSMVSENSAIAVNHSYTFKDTFIPKAVVTPTASKEIADATKVWFEGLTSDILGV